MALRNKLLGLIAALVIVALAAVTSAASVSLTDVEVNGIDVIGRNVVVSEFDGSNIPVRIQFNANGLNGSVSEDVRVKAWFSGSKAYAAVTDRFDVLSGREYTRTLSVPISVDLDDLEEDVTLNIVVESENGELASKVVDFTIQRESYQLEVLDVDFESEVEAGKTLRIDVVVKNTGRHFADDTFVKVSIPALGIEDRAYFEDLSPEDQTDPDYEDSRERTLYLKVPSKAPTGLYALEVEAYNDDSISSVSRKVVILAESESSTIVSPKASKTFAVGESAEYSLILVNTGDKIKVYDLNVEADKGLNVELDETIVAVPAGSSRTVGITATATEAGKLYFDVNVNSGLETVKTERFVAEVESNVFAGNSTVIVTVILAIIFVVLLVVLIVLLTRNPQKNDEISESYY
jgi:hypothetical protein